MNSLQGDTSPAKEVKSKEYAKGGYGFNQLIIKNNN